MSINLIPSRTGKIFVLAALLLGAVPLHAHPLKIVSFTASTGDDALPAKAFEQGAQLGAEKHPGTTLQFFAPEAGNSPESPQLKALVAAGDVPLVIYWSVDELAAVASYLNQSSVIGLAEWDVTKKMPRLGNHMFGFGYSLEGSFNELAKYAGNKLKSYRFGIVSSSVPRFDTQAKAFIEQSKSLGNTVVFDEKVEAGVDGYAALIARAQKEKCDTVFAALPGASVVAFVKAARTGGFKGKILVGDTLFAPELAGLGKDGEGIYMIQSWSDDAAFKSAYAAKYGEVDGVTLGAAALGYDTVNCVRSSASMPDASSIKYGFLSEPCQGLTGITQFSGERIAQRKKKVLTVKNGAFALAE